MKTFKPKYSFQFGLLALILIQTIHTGYVVSASYRLYTFMRVRFDWPVDMVATYNSIYGQASLPGAALGSFVTGRLLSKGRKLCMIVATLVSIIGILVQLIENMWLIFLGKAITGFSMGMYAAYSGRIFEEFVPWNLYGFVMTLYMFLQ